MFQVKLAQNSNNFNEEKNLKTNYSSLIMFMAIIIVYINKYKSAIYHLK